MDSISAGINNTVDRIKVAVSPVVLESVGHIALLNLTE